jgi:hypothetical protein
LSQTQEGGVDRLLSAGLYACFAAAANVSLAFPFEARLLPLSAGLAGAAATGLLLLARLRTAAVPDPLEPPREFVHWRLIANFAALLALLPVLGVVPAGAFYAGTHALVELRAPIWRAAVLAGGAALALWLLFGVWLRLPLGGSLL